MNTGNHNPPFLRPPFCLTKQSLITKLSLVFILFFSLFVFSTQAKAADPYTVATNDQILKTVQGYKGDIVILSVFASWCPPCVEEARTFVKFYKKYPPSSGVHLLGVSLDETGKDLKTFISDRGIKYPVYLCGQDVVNFFEIETIPTLILFDREGRVSEYAVGIASMDELEKLVAKYK